MRKLAFFTAGLLGAFLILEGLCRTLPVMAGWDNPPVSQAYPFVRNRPFAHYVYSNGWDLRHVVRGRFNSLGFSSPEPQAGTNVAIVGDSFVEASMLDPSQRLSPLINSRQTRFRAASFGRAGADLSDYLVVGRWIVEHIRPQFLVFVITKDDVGNSLAPKKRGYWFVRGEGGELGFRSDVQFGLRNLLLRSRLLSYVLYNLKFGPSMMFGGDAGQSNDRETPQDTGKAPSPRDEALLDMAMDRFAALQADGTRVILAFDADRAAVYGHRARAHTSDYEALASRAAERGIAICDLSLAFRRDYEIRKQPFDPDGGQGHWNAAGSSIVADALLRSLTLPPPRVQDSSHISSAERTERRSDPMTP